MTTIRLAIVGLGKIARDQHLPAIRGDASFQLVATVDGKQAGIDGVPHFHDLVALLKDGPRVDAVVICTPPQVRGELAAAALTQGLHVFLEKPPAATLSEVAALCELAQARRVTLFAGWHSRFAPGVEPARAWLANRRLRRVTVTWHEDVRQWHPGQAWIWQAGGFGVFDPGINALSIMTHILPHPIFLTRALLSVPSNCAAPMVADMNFRDQTGTQIAMNFDFGKTGDPAWDIVVETDDGVLKLHNGGAVLVLPTGTERHEAREYPGLYACFGSLIRSGRSDVDIAPLRIVADAYLRAERETVAPFIE